jgi:hypothetical protein
MKALVRRLRRSLAAPLILLVAAFIAVPILFYLTFQQADLERQEMLLGSIQPLLPIANFDCQAFLAIIIDYCCGIALARPLHGRAG